MNTSPPPVEAPPRAEPAPRVTPSTGLGAEVRESVVLLVVALSVTVGLTAVAQAALSALA
jgi:hypothetical protein